jgi:hypothetical protein
MIMIIIIIFIIIKRKRKNKSATTTASTARFFFSQTFLTSQFTFLSAKELAQPPAADIHSILPLLNPTIFCFKTSIKSEAKITQKKEEKEKEAKITNTIMKYHIENFSTKGKFHKTFFFSFLSNLINTPTRTQI